MDDKRPVTADVMRAYISVLEKQVQQMTLVVTTLEELNDKLEKVEGHFHNGFRSEITGHITDQIANVMEKMEKALTTIYIIKDYVERAEESDKDMSSKAYELTNDVKEKISGIKGDMAELKSAIKVDRVTNIIGWSTFIVTMITIVLKLFGKL
jgi:predicted transcriptional regulator